MKNRERILYACLVVVLALTLAIVSLPGKLIDTETATGPDIRNKHCRQPYPAPALTAVEVERDNIFSLLAFAIAEKGWQTAGANYRGHNIAAVLVDEHDRILCWSRNAIHATRNATQHAEVRLIVNFLNNSRQFRFHKHRIYVTLEPCAMCAGMMALSRVREVIYGQKDGSNVFERLALDTSDRDGYCPYRYQVHARKSNLDIGDRLSDVERELHAQGLPNHGHPRTRPLFTEAANRLHEFKPEHEENVAIVERALAFLDRVPADYTPTPYTVACSGQDSNQEPSVD